MIGFGILLGCRHILCKEGGRWYALVDVISKKKNSYKLGEGGLGVIAKNFDDGDSEGVIVSISC